VQIPKKYTLLILLLLQSSFAYAQSTYQEVDSLEQVDISSQAAITWPVLPGESVEDIAALFYPKNRIMQQRFIAKTLKLSYETNPSLSPTTISNQASLIVIPNIQSLGRHSGKINAKSSKSIDEAIEAKIRQQASYVVMSDDSYELSPKFQAIYDDLLRRNLLFKKGLVELNTRLANLQQILAALKIELIRIIDLAFSSAEIQTKTVNKTQEMTATGTRIVNNHINNAPIESAKESSPFPSQMNDATSEMVKAQYAITDLLMPTLLLFLVVSSFLYVRKHLINYHPISSANRNSKEKKAKTKSLDFKNDAVPSMQAITLPLPEARIAVSNFSGSIPDVDADTGINLEQRKEADIALEQAKIYANVSRFKEAITLLKTQIQWTPKLAIHHWFYLLDLYRKGNEKEAFLRNAKRLHENFNVMPPKWEKSRFPILAATSIEELPHIVDRLTTLWATEGRLTENMIETKAYLDDLLMDNRNTERMGFGVEVFQDILLLRDLLDMRLKLALDGLS
jgi:hypothetical protein